MGMQVEYADGDQEMLVLALEKVSEKCVSGNVDCDPHGTDNWLGCGIWSEGVRMSVQSVSGV
jgi:hypothetical protein